MCTGRSTQDDTRTLHAAGFEVGDYLDVAITLPPSDIGHGPVGGSASGYARPPRRPMRGGEPLPMRAGRN